MSELRISGDQPSSDTSLVEGGGVSSNRGRWERGFSPERSLVRIGGSKSKRKNRSILKRGRVVLILPRARRGFNDGKSRLICGWVAEAD